MSTEHSHELGRPVRRAHYAIRRNDESVRLDGWRLVGPPGRAAVVARELAAAERRAARALG